MPFDFDADPLSLSGLFPATTAPVQVDIYGYCQMACFYCFSNLNKDVGGRKINLRNSAPALFPRLARVLDDEEDVLGWLLREKYFVGFSNTTDPFQRAEKEYRASEAFLAWASVNKQPLFVETKGNVLLEEWDRYAPMLDPARTAVYVSLTTLDLKTSRRVEPGAQPPAARLELMRRLAALGCGVIAACNPYVPEWVPDLDAYCEAARDAGATDVFPFYLHFTPEQEEHVPAFYRAEVERANALPVVQARGLLAWREAAARAGLRCALPPYWDAYFGYPSGAFTAEQALRGRGQQVYWFHDFLKRVAQHGEDHGGVPVLFSWRTVEKYLAEAGVPNPALKTRPLDACFANSTEGHKEFRRKVGAKAPLWAVLRWLYNSPWFGKRTVWSDPHVKALYCGKDDVYEADRNGDLIGVHFPRPRRKEWLHVEAAELDMANVAKMPD